MDSSYNVINHEELCHHSMSVFFLINIENVYLIVTRNSCEEEREQCFSDPAGIAGREGPLCMNAI
jgi:hypothetical protein